MKYWREYRRGKIKAATALAHIAIKITLGFIVHTLYINIGIFGYKIRASQLRAHPLTLPSFSSLYVS